jgi:hypothetical protein
MTRHHHRQHDPAATLRHGQATPSCLLAQDEDLILHIVRGQVGFNKDHWLPCADQGTKYLPFFTLLFSLYPIFICRSEQV